MTAMEVCLHHRCLLVYGVRIRPHHQNMDWRGLQAHANANEEVCISMVSDLHRHIVNTLQADIRPLHHHHFA